MNQFLRIIPDQRNMAKVLGLISIALVCVWCQTALADTFACTDEPSACKTKFGTQFEKAFKDIHIPAVRELFNTYIDLMNGVKAELSPDNPFVKRLTENVEAVQKSLQKVNDNVDNDKKLGEAIKEGMEAFSIELGDSPEVEEIRELLKQHNIKEKLVSSLRKLGARTGELWAEMYSGLREEDLKAYPEYAEVNQHMENLRGHGTEKPSGTQYIQAAEILGSKFDLPYFQTHYEIS